MQWVPLCDRDITDIKRSITCSAYLGWVAEKVGRVGSGRVQQIGPMPISGVAWPVAVMTKSVSKLTVKVNCGATGPEE